MSLKADWSKFTVKNLIIDIYNTFEFNTQLWTRLNKAVRMYNSYKKHSYTPIALITKKLLRDMPPV
jgi:hypothetical protein